jgi:hypothetical protein
LFTHFLPEINLPCVINKNGKPIALVPLEIIFTSFWGAIRLGWIGIFGKFAKTNNDVAF